MFSQQGRRKEINGRGSRHPNRIGDTHHVIQKWVFQLHDKTSFDCLRITESLINGGNLRCWNLSILEPNHPFIRIALKKQLLKQGDQSLTIANTRGVGLEQWVSPYRLFDSDELSELLPQRLGGNSNNEVTLVPSAEEW